jgi:SRSO17 transposase
MSFDGLRYARLSGNLVIRLANLSGQASEARFASYVGALAEVIGHADRAEPLNDYCVGLLIPGERKNVEPMAAIVAPA